MPASGDFEEGRLRICAGRTLPCGVALPVPDTFCSAPTTVAAVNTYEQCLATASGRRAYCDANPFDAYPGRQAVVPPKKHYRYQ